MKFITIVFGHLFKIIYPIHVCFFVIHLDTHNLKIFLILGITFLKKISYSVMIKNLFTQIRMLDYSQQCNEEISISTMDKDHSMAPS